MLQRTNPLIAHLEKLYYLVCIADAGSFLAASRSLKIAQPSLSQSIAILENAVGVSLFNRTRTGVRLSAEGQVIYQFAKETMRQSLEALQAVTADKGMAGTLAVSTYDFLTSSIWPRVHKQVIGAKPKLRLTIRIEPTNARSVALLLANEVDLFIGVEPILPKDIAKSKIFSDTFSFFATDAWLQAFRKSRRSKAPLTAEDLEAADLLYVPETIISRNLTLQDCLYGLGLRTQPAHRVYSYSAIRALALQNLAVAVLPNFLDSFHAGDGRLRRLDTVFNIDFASHDFYLCCNASRAEDPRIRCVIESFLELKSDYDRSLSK